MARSLRSARKRYAIFRQQNGQCAICGLPLGDDFHVDHIHAFTHGGKTVYPNLQAVHPICNLKKGSSVKHVQLLPGNLRPDIYHGIETIVNRYQAKEVATSISLPPRYGKSDIIRASALELIELGAPTSVVIGPWSVLADQIKALKQVRDMYQRFGITMTTPFNMHRCVHLPTSHWWRKTNGVYNLISMTIGLVNAHLLEFIDGLEELRDTYGKQVPLFADECHLIKTTQKWGRIIERAQEFVYFVPLTGTPVLGMPGFEDTYEDWQEAERIIHRKRIDKGERKQFKETYAGRTRKVESIEANVTVSWQRAWDIHALAPVNAIWVDTNVVEGDEVLGLLSEMKEGQLAGGLKNVIESEDMTRKLANVGVDRLLARKKGTQMLVLTGFDSGGAGPRNIHAEALKEAIENELESHGMTGQFRIMIATTVNSDGTPDDTATQTIEAFRNGLVDILIVKLMGIVGLDVPNCKIEIYASPIRKGPMALQGLSRPFTANPNNLVADLIMPRDPAMVHTYKVMIEDQGGAASESEMAKVAEEEEPLQEAVRGVFRAEDSYVHGYADQHGQEEAGDHEKVLAMIKDKYNTGGLTDLEILQNFRLGGFPITPEDEVNYDRQKAQEQAAGFKDADQHLDETSGQFGPRAQALMRQYGWTPQEDEYQERIRKLMAAAKRYVGFTGRVNEVDDVDLLRRLIDALGTVAQQELGR